MYDENAIDEIGCDEAFECSDVEAFNRESDNDEAFDEGDYHMALIDEELFDRFNPFKAEDEDEWREHLLD